MAEETNIILLPKIKKVELKSRLMLDPSDFRKGLPKSKLPQLTDKGLILSLAPQNVPLCRMNEEGTLKINIKYNAQVLMLIGRYVEVKVIDDYKDLWIGILFGITVKGTGGQGKIRGCKIVEIKDEMLIAQALNEGGVQPWKNLVKKIQSILDQDQ